jgi:hypothetical protein
LADEGGRGFGHDLIYHVRQLVALATLASIARCAAATIFSRAA